MYAVPHVVAAPDKYRGTLSALDAAQAVARAAADAGWSCDVAPMSDGREGFLDAFAGFGRYQSSTGDRASGCPGGGAVAPRSGLR